MGKRCMSIRLEKTMQVQKEKKLVNIFKILCAFNV